jgi:plasmid stability protein
VNRALSACSDCNAIIAEVANITIRRLPESVKARLRVRAAHHGCSMEEEARQILKAALTHQRAGANLAESIRGRFAALGGVELSIPPRDAMRRPPKLGK